MSNKIICAAPFREVRRIRNEFVGRKNQHGYGIVTQEKALALAQWLKRAGFSEYRPKAVSDHEASSMRDGAARIARSFDENGYSPDNYRGKESAGWSAHLYK